jgi:8-oxo-dGTP pyrophosphatase MutT (NUDIX family)
VLPGMRSLSMLDNFLLNDAGLQPSDAVVGLIVLPDGRYLMQLRSQKAGFFYPDHWGLFGGAVDPGEGPDEALSRGAPGRSAGDRW